MCIRTDLSSAKNQSTSVSVDFMLRLKRRFDQVACRKWM